MHLDDPGSLCYPWGRGSLWGQLLREGQLHQPVPERQVFRSDRYVQLAQQSLCVRLVQADRLGQQGLRCPCHLSNRELPSDQDSPERQQVPERQRGLEGQCNLLDQPNRVNPWDQ
jgi:hypothetical protein